MSAARPMRDLFDVAPRRLRPAETAAPVQAPAVAGPPEHPDARHLPADLRAWRQRHPGLCGLVHQRPMARDEGKVTCTRPVPPGWLYCRAHGVSPTLAADVARGRRP